MAKIDDMLLFEQVVKSGGLAAAGRVIGLSPASMTAKIKQIEHQYQTRLLIRNTRSIRLTEAGERFYLGCVRVAEEVRRTESALASVDPELRGAIKITAPADFGHQYLAPALAEFVELHPGVKPSLRLTDGLVDLVAEGVDVAIRFGHLPDSSLIAKGVLANRRVLCASPGYLEKRGWPSTPDDLLSHQCLVMERQGQLMNDWFFRMSAPQVQFVDPLLGTEVVSRSNKPRASQNQSSGAAQKIKVSPFMSSSDGGIIRQWALAGCGIAMKSSIDIHQDLKRGALLSVFEHQSVGLSIQEQHNTELHFLYPSRQYQPAQVVAFKTFFEQWLMEHCV